MPHRFRKLPKVELHRHAEGSLRAETLWEFHRRAGQALYSTFEEMKAAVTIPRGECPGFPAFLSRFNALYFRYGGIKEMERLAVEYIADAADDNVIYIEMRFSPAFFARRMKENPVAGPGGGWLGQPPEPREIAEEVAEAMIAAAQGEARRRGIQVGFILTLGRHFKLAGNLPQAELLDRPIGKQFCGVDLAGFEAIPAAEFRAIFDASRARGSGITIHAGEDPHGPGPANVSEAIDELHATRIGHGVRAAEDAALVARLAEKKIVLEMCPTSNLQTQACASASVYPLKRFLDAGVRVTVNTDDPAISQITLSDEYARLADECGVTFEELRRCTLTAAEAGFLEAGVRGELVRRIEAGWSA